MFNFPWSNFHELNLDWILSVVKEAKEVFDNGRSDIDYAVETADEAKEIATQAAEATIADNSVSTSKIQDGAVTNAKLANNSVTSANIVDRTIIGNDIAENTIESYNIKNGTIIGADIAENAITGYNIAPGAVTYSKLGDNAVDTAKINDGAVTLSKLAQSIQNTLTTTEHVAVITGLDLYKAGGFCIAVFSGCADSATIPAGWRPKLNTSGVVRGTDASNGRHCCLATILTDGTMSTSFFVPESTSAGSFTGNLSGSFIYPI